MNSLTWIALFVNLLVLQAIPIQPDDAANQSLIGGGPMPWNFPGSPWSFPYMTGHQPGPWPWPAPPMWGLPIAFDGHGNKPLDVDSLLPTVKPTEVVEPSTEAPALPTSTQPSVAPDDQIGSLEILEEIPSAEKMQQLLSDSVTVLFAPSNRKVALIKTPK